MQIEKWSLLPSLWEGLGEGLAKTKLTNLPRGLSARAEASFGCHRQVSPPLTPPRGRGIYSIT
jgi:hypothetical protein